MAKENVFEMNKRIAAELEMMTQERDKLKEGLTKAKEKALADLKEYQDEIHEKDLEIDKLKLEIKTLKAEKQATEVETEAEAPETEVSDECSCPADDAERSYLGFTLEEVKEYLLPGEFEEIVNMIDDALDMTDAVEKIMRQARDRKRFLEKVII